MTAPIRPTLNRVVIPPLTRFPAPPPADAHFCQFQGQAMGTSWSVKCFSTVKTPNIQHAIDVEIARTIALFSPWQPDSEISLINRSTRTRLTLSSEFADFLAQVLALAQQSGGTFDPCLGTLVDLWGFGPSGRRPQHAPLPNLAQIEQAKSVSGWHRIGLDHRNRQLDRPVGLKFDFSGCAKGWAVDQVSAALCRLGVDSHMIEIGGEVVARGLKPDLQPWWIAIERPAGAVGRPLLVALTDLAMASSGDYRHVFTHQGQDYSHTIDGTIGWPVQSQIASVTVLAADALQADALASALMVMEPRRAMDFAAAHDLPAILFERHPDGLRELCSPSFRKMSEDSDDA